jgi:predicted PurR-regulated permease PerM
MVGSPAMAESARTPSTGSSQGTTAAAGPGTPAAAGRAAPARPAAAAAHPASAARLAPAATASEERNGERAQLQWSTVFRVLLTALLCWVVYELWALVLTCLVSLLLAIAAAPLVAWGERRGMSRGMAVFVVGAATLAVAVLAILFVAPPLAEQIQGLMRNLSLFSHRAVAKVRPASPFLAGVLEEVFQLPTSPQVATWLRKPLVWGQAAVEGAAVGAFAFMLAIYLLLHGKRTYAWLLAYVPRRLRGKMAETVPEVSEVVLAYTRGQILTTALFITYAFAALTALGVPAALPLALLAGLCDVIPIVGIMLATAPAVLLALTVSHVVAGAVLALYLLYAAFESYVLVPRLYGHHLRLSPLTVLLALAIGGRLQGIAGALLILPLVAAYPIVERIWLSGYVGDEVFHDHSALEQASETEAMAVVEAVLQGVPQAEEPRS